MITLSLSVSFRVWTDKHHFITQKPAVVNGPTVDADGRRVDAEGRRASMLYGRNAVENVLK